MKAILLAVVACIGFGVAGPVSKVAFNKGMHPDGFALSYAIGLLIFVGFTAISHKESFAALYPSPGALIWGMGSGLLCAIALKANATALSISGSLVSVICVIVAIFPLITSAISLTFLNEASKVILWKFIAGTALVLGGTVLVVTSIRK